MISKIQRKEYSQIRRLRKLGVAPRAIVLRMPDGKYYKNTKTDIIGVKELQAVRKKIDEELAKVQTLF